MSNHPLTNDPDIFPAPPFPAIDHEREAVLKEEHFNFAIYAYNDWDGPQKYEWAIIGASRSIFEARAVCAGFLISNRVKLRNIHGDDFMPTMHKDEREGEWRNPAQIS